MAWRKSSFALLAAASFAVAEKPLTRFESAAPHMGTLARITLYAPHSAVAQRAFAAAFARIHAIDAALSDYHPESEVTRLPAGAPVAISDDLFRVLRVAQTVSRASHGAFDVTLGPLTRLWREARRTRHPPSAESIAEAKRKCGYLFLHLDARKRSVSLLKPGMQLDLGGIGKGFAAEEAILTLRKAGIRRALVAIAGDIAAGEAAPGTTGWRVEAAGALVVIRNQSISTSGDSEQHLDASGVRYSHILDSGTGMGVANSKPVSIVARHGAVADALATAAAAIPEPEIASLLKGFHATRIHTQAK
ncbi:MAG: FAD:protein FMN transferase [Candidatus Solibacter usitatus]|nr:FAD:protein FMN transferase [Candidatus Solibacter usitatus]